MTVVPETGPLRALSAADVAEHAAPAMALEAARSAAVAQRHATTSTGRLTLPFPGGWMRVLAASLPELGVFGYKQFHLSQVGSVRYAVHVFSTDDGRPLGLVDGAHLTPLRTAAAATAAACRILAPVDSPIRVGVVGSGTEARAGLRALADALDVSGSVVWSRSDTNRREFARDMSDAVGSEVTPVEDLAQIADSGVDVVYVATNSGGRVVAGEPELADVPLVLSIGSTLPEQRELHGDLLSGAERLVVDTPDVLIESGDAIAAAAIDPARVLELGELLEGVDDQRHPPRRTVYKSIGSPEQDLVLAARLLDAAATHQFGRRIEPLTDVKWNK